MTGYTRKEASVVSIVTALTLGAAAVSGGMWLGAVAQEVDQLTAAQTTAQADHDRLIAVETTVDAIKDDVEETKDDIKEIKKLLQDMDKD